MDKVAELRKWLSAAEGCRPTCRNITAFDELIATQRGRLPMDAADHTRLVGSVITNFQALETHLRYFLLKASGQQVSFPKKGDKEAAYNYLTDWVSLGSLVKKYNDGLSAGEAKFRVDQSLIDVRNAIAHGRLVTETELPATLWKFGEPKSGRVPVEFCETLTKEWLVKTSNLIDAQRQKVLDCFAARGYEGLR